MVVLLWPAFEPCLCTSYVLANVLYKPAQGVQSCFDVVGNRILQYDHQGILGSQGYCVLFAVQLMWQSFCYLT
jgi:hypothetical protein